MIALHVAKTIPIEQLLASSRQGAAGRAAGAAARAGGQGGSASGAGGAGGERVDLTSGPGGNKEGACAC